MLNNANTEKQEAKINDKIEIPKNAIKLNIKSDKNNSYEVIFFIFEECLVFIANSQNLVPQKKYKKIYTFQEVLKKNKYFCMCDNINDIIEEIKYKTNEKENEVKLNEKENLIILSIPLHANKIKECSFEIDEISNNINSDINAIYSFINQLLNEISNLKEKNRLNEEKIKTLELKNQILEKKMKKLIHFFFRNLKKRKKKRKKKKKN